jgi:predicted ATP-grasp superfamily ATP-dependent carboligase
VSHQLRPRKPLALVVGLSINGLAIARALAREGVTVHCLCDSQTPTQPAAYTRYAQVHFRLGLNTGPLAQFLVELAAEIGSPEKIVLFPTSDRISKAIATSWNELEPRYLLSWAHCRDLVLRLQRKDTLAEYCERAGVTYPKSRVLSSAAEVASIADSLRFPLVVKPAQPLSSFKAIRLDDSSDLQRCVATYARDLPFVVQEWIEGPEPSLYSCTTYLDRGRSLYMLTSRKLAASPPGTGQGTVFETIDDEQTAQIASTFLGQMDLSGPVAVEFKRDANGRFWLIEPNVGRMEYCVDLAIHSGFNLPYVEYLHVTQQMTAAALPTRAKSCAWFDTDKDPACFLANLRSVRDESGRWRKIVFPFVGHGDWRPLFSSVLQQLGRWLKAAGRRLVPTTARRVA